MEVTVARFTQQTSDTRCAVVARDVFPDLLPYDPITGDGKSHHFTVNGKRCLTTIVEAIANAALVPKTIALSKEIMELIQVKAGDKVVLRAAEPCGCENITFRPVNNGEIRKSTLTGEIFKKVIEGFVSNETANTVNEAIDNIATAPDHKLEEAIRGLCRDRPHGYPVHVHDVIKLSNGLELYVEDVEDGKFKYGMYTTATVLTPSVPIDRRKIEERLKANGLEDVGGLDKEVQEFRLMAEMPLCHPELFTALAAPVPRGILLFGPPGSGKTNLARAYANETGIYMKVINGPECLGSLAGQTEKTLRDAFDDCRRQRPAILFLDEIDAIAPKRDKTQGELEKRIVAQLLTLMDGMTSNDGVLVIGATNRPNSIDPALRRYGRFDKEIHIGVPDEKGRLEILMKHIKGMPVEDNINWEKIVAKCHGFVGADLAALAAEATLNRIQRFCTADIDRKENQSCEKVNFHETIPAEQLEKLKVDQSDFDAALSKVSPSAMREAMIEKPSVTWNDIGGHERVKTELRQMIELPVKHPELFEKMKMQPSRGVLFYGPSGCGKTLMAKAVANEAKANFISVKGPEMLTMWFGESEANIRELFARARAAAPCVIFFDEIDSIAPARGQGDSSGVTDRVINQLLTEMDGMDSKKNVFVIGATNRPDAMDSALLRPGRLDQLVYIPLPDSTSRLQIFEHNLKHCSEEGVSYNQLVEKTSGYSGADISGICQLACKLAILDYAEGQVLEGPVILKKHIEEAMRRSRKSVSEGHLRAFEMFANSQKGENVEGDNSNFTFVPEEGVESTRSSGSPREGAENVAESEEDDEYS